MTNVLKTLFCLAVLTSCCPARVISGLTDEDFITKHGIFVHPQKNLVSPIQIETALDYSKDYITSRFSDVYTVEDIDDVYANDIHVYVRDSSFYCLVMKKDELEWVTCSGYFISRRVEYVNEDCIADTSFVHELIHLMNYWVEDYVDREHTRSGFFGSGAGSMLYDVNLELEEIFCPNCW